MEFAEEHIRREAHEKHKRWHRLYAEGVPIRAALLSHLQSGTRVVRVDSSDHRKSGLPAVAYKLAGVAGKSSGYGLTYSPGDVSTTPYLYVMDHRAVGYLSTKEIETYLHLDSRTVHEGRRPCAYHIFVCEAYRRYGVATSLIERYASDMGVAPPEIAFGVPLSTTGHGLARSVAGEGLLVGM